MYLVGLHIYYIRYVYIKVSMLHYQIKITEWSGMERKIISGPSMKFILCSYRMLISKGYCLYCNNE